MEEENGCYSRKDATAVAEMLLWKKRLLRSEELLPTKGVVVVLLEDGGKEFLLLMEC